MATTMFNQIQSELKKNVVYGPNTYCYPRAPAYLSLHTQLLFLAIIDEFWNCRGDKETKTLYTSLARSCVNAVLKNLDRDSGCLLENTLRVGKKQKRDDDTHFGRKVVISNSFLTIVLLTGFVQKYPDVMEYTNVSENFGEETDLILSWVYEHGWDHQNGGFYTIVDSQGKPRIEPDWCTKQSGVNLEAISALAVGTALDQEKWGDKLNKCWEFIQEHLEDKENGEFFAVLAPNNCVMLDIKGSPQKGCYRGQRGLYETHKALQGYIDEKFPAYSFTIVKAPVDNVNSVKDEIEDALAAALDVDLEDVCAAFVPHKDNTILKCNLADSPGLKDKLNDPNVDNLVRDALMADPKIKEAIGDQSLTAHGALLSGVEPEVLDDNLPLIEMELADILDLPDNYISKIDDLGTPVGTLLMFDHPAAAKFEEPVLKDLIDRLKEHPGLENVDLVDELPHNFTFPVASPGELNPLHNELKESMACATVAPQIHRPSDELPELKDAYYKVPPPIDSVDIDHITPCPEGSDIPYLVAVPIVTEPMVQGIKDGTFDDLLMKELLKQPGVLDLLKELDCVDSHTIPICQVEPKDVNAVLFDIEKDFGEILDKPVEKVSSTTTPEDENVWIEFNMIKEPGLDEKINAPTVDDDLRNKLWYDEPVSKRVPDQRLKDKAFCLSGVDHEKAEKNLPNIEDELAKILGVPNQACPIFDKVLDFPEGPVVVLSAPRCCPISLGNEKKLARKLRNQDGLENVGIVPTVSYDYPFEKVNSKRLRPYHDQLEEGVAKACVSPDLKDRMEPPAWSDEPSVPYYTAPPPEDDIHQKTLLPMKNGTKVHYGVDTNAIDKPIAQAILDDRFNDIITKEMMRIPGLKDLMDKAGLIDHHRFPLAKCSPEEAGLIKAEMEQDMAKALGVPAEQVCAEVVPDDDNSWVNFSLKDSPEMKEKLGDKDVDKNFRKALANDERVTNSDVPDQRLNDEAMCFTGVPNKVVEKALPKMKEDLADLMGIPLECVPDIVKANVPEGSLMAFDHPAAAGFTPEMLDEFMDGLRNKPGFENVGLTDKITHVYSFPGASKQQIDEDEVCNAISCIPVRTDMCKPECDGVLPPHEFAEVGIYYYADVPPEDKVEILKMKNTGQGADVTTQLAVDVFTVTMVEDVADEKFDDIIFNETIKRPDLCTVLKQRDIVFPHPFPLVKTDLHKAKLAEIALEETTADALGISLHDIAITEFEVSNDNVLCHFTARNTPENLTKLKDRGVDNAIRKALNEQPRIMEVIPDQSMEEKAVCVEGVPTNNVKNNIPIVEEALNDAMGTPEGCCKVVDVCDNPDGPIIIFDHPKIVPATDEKMQDFIDKLRKHPAFRNAKLKPTISYVLDFRFGNPDDLDPLTDFLVDGMAQTAKLPNEHVDIDNIGPSPHDSSAVAYSIDTDVVTKDLAKKSEVGDLDEPLLIALFTEEDFANHLVERGKVLYQNVPLVGCQVKDVKKVKTRLQNKVCNDMRIEPEDMVVIVKENGKAVDLKFYIKATPSNRKFVEDGKLKDSVYRAIAEDPKINGLIPEQKPEDRAVCLHGVPMELAEENLEPLLQEHIGQACDLPKECIEMVALVEVPEGPLAIFAHPDIVPFDELEEENLVNNLQPVDGFEVVSCAPSITHDFPFALCEPDKVLSLEPQFIKALSDVIKTPEDQIGVKKMLPTKGKDDEPGTIVRFEIETPGINRNFTNGIMDGTLDDDILEALYDDPEILDLLEDLGVLTSVEIPLVETSEDDVDKINPLLLGDMAKLLDIDVKDIRRVKKPMRHNCIVKFYAPTTPKLVKQKEDEDLDDLYRKIINANDDIMDVIPDQTLVDRIVCLNSTSAKKVDEHDGIVKQEFADSLEVPPGCIKFLDNTDIPGGSLTVMTHPKIKPVTDDTLNTYILGLRENRPFKNAQLTDKVCVAFFFPQVSPEELDPLKGELRDCLAQVLEMQPDAIVVFKLSKKPQDDHTQVIYVIDADFLTPKNARILMKTNFNELLLEELQKYPGINALLTRKGIIGRYLTCDITLENVSQEQLHPYETDLVECFVRAMGPEAIEEDVMIVSLAEDGMGTAVSFQIRETEVATEALQAPDFEEKYMEELAKIPGLAELLGLSKTFLTANIALTDIEASEIEPYTEPIAGCLARALFTQDENVSINDLKQSGDDTLLGFQVLEDDTTSRSLRDPEFQSRLFDEFAKIEGLNYLLGLKLKEVFQVRAYGEAGVPRLRHGLDDNDVFYGLVNMNIKNGKKHRTVLVMLQFLGQKAPAAKQEHLQALISDAQSAFGEVDGALNFTGKNQVQSDLIMEYLPDCFKPGDIDLDDQSKKRQHHQPIITDDGVMRFVTDDGDDAKERVAEIMSIIHSKIGWCNWVLFKTNPKRLELAHEGSFGAGSIYAMKEHFTTNDVLWGLLRLSFGVQPLRRTHLVMIHWIGPRTPNVKRGRLNAQYNKMDALLRPFGVALQFTRLEDFNVHNVIDKVRDIVVTDGDDDDDNDSEKNRSLVEAFKAALEEEEEHNENVDKRLKIDREAQGDLTLSEIVDYVRMPDSKDINWLLVSPTDPAGTN